MFSGLGTDVHFSGDETGLQWEDYLFEMQNAVEWRMVMSRGQDELSLTVEPCGYCRGASKNTRTGQLVSKLSAGVDNFWPCEGARETRAE